MTDISKMKQAVTDTLRKVVKSTIVPSVEDKLDAAMDGRDLVQEKLDLAEANVRLSLEERGFHVGDITMSPDGRLDAEITIQPVTPVFVAVAPADLGDDGGGSDE